MSCEELAIFSANFAYMAHFWGMNDKVKAIFSSQSFLQNTNKRIRLYYYDTSGRLAFVRFLEEMEDTKNIPKLIDLPGVILGLAYQ